MRFSEDVEDDSLGHAGLAVLPVHLHGHGLGVRLADGALPVHSLGQHHGQLPGVLPTAKIQKINIRKFNLVLDINYE